MPRATSYPGATLAPPVLVLGLTTATSTCGVALWDGDRLLADAHIYIDRSHARRLAPLVQETLAHARREARALDAVAVVAGPGSFTGLRIGASTAKGLCLATGAALVAVPSDEALAASADVLPQNVLYVLPSRRGEVLAAARSGPLAPVRLDALAEVADGCRFVLGPNADAVADAVAETLGLGPIPQDIRAGAVARLGAERLADGDTADVAAFEPDYGQAFVPSQPAPIFGGPRP